MTEWEDLKNKWDKKLEKMRKLNPGDKLTWVRPPLDRRFQSGAYPYEMYGEHHGEPVEFTSQTGRNDIQGFPVILVKTKVGQVEFSSNHFN